MARDASPTGVTPPAGAAAATLPTTDLNVTASSTGCVRTQGDYKNEFQYLVVQAAGVALGSTTYTPSQIDRIYKTPVAGNGLIALAHQLITAKLNIYYLASAPQSVVDAINAADALIGSLGVPPVGTDYLKTSLTRRLITVLDNFNSGLLGTPPYA